MISSEQCDRIERYLMNTASAGRPATSVHIADQLGLTPPEVNSCLRQLFKEGRVHRAERVGTLFYWVPKVGEQDIKFISKPAPGPVPDPAEYAEEDLSDAPKPKKEPKDDLDEQIVALFNQGKSNQDIKKELKIKRIDHVDNAIKRLLKEKRIQPRTKDNFRAVCGKEFKNQAGVGNHEHWCRRCQLYKDQEALPQVEQAPCTTTTGMNQSWSSTLVLPPAPPPKDAMTRLKEAVEELKAQGFFVYVSIKTEV